MNEGQSDSVAIDERTMARSASIHLCMAVCGGDTLYKRVVHVTRHGPGRNRQIGMLNFLEVMLHGMAMLTPVHFHYMHRTL